MPRMNVRQFQRVIAAGAIMAVWAGAQTAVLASGQADAAPRASAARAGGAAVDGRGMWVWYVSRSAGGNVAAIAAQAAASGVRTLFIKAADGGSAWSQFTPVLVAALHARGLQVCAWQYVYGTNPLGEAAVGARAARYGADCLIIDAEAEYEGRYASAQVYLHALRGAVGRGYPLGLASFPYVDDHPAFPYSVFLGPGGAQFDLPQMYWRDIGASVPEVFHHTYTYNRVYRRAIYPVGQTYGPLGPGDVESFRATTARYRAGGVSWWDFAWTSAQSLWPALNAPYASVGSIAPLGYPVLGPGSKGDDVLWLQEHLASPYAGQHLDGLFGGQTRGYLAAFQAAHGLGATGRTDTATWLALLRVRPVSVAWAAASVASASDARRVGPRVATLPASARLPARLYEIPELGSQHSARRPGAPDPASR
jgi:hypothetical protein